MNGLDFERSELGTRTGGPKGFEMSVYGRNKTLHMKNGKVTVGITPGDGNGIGYEVIIKSLADARILSSFTPVIYGSSKIFGFYRKLLHNIDQLDTNVISSARDAHDKRLNIVNCLPDNIFVEPGQSTPESAKCAIRSCGLS